MNNKVSANVLTRTHPQNPEKTRPEQTQQRNKPPTRKRTTPNHKNPQIKTKTKPRKHLKENHHLQANRK